jgi:hypothetical protein
MEIGSAHGDGHPAILRSTRYCQSEHKSSEGEHDDLQEIRLVNLITGRRGKERRQPQLLLLPTPETAYRMKEEQKEAEEKDSRGTSIRYYSY